LPGGGCVSRAIRSETALLMIRREKLDGTLA
jgi:hypothetical protein